MKGKSCRGDSCSSQAASRIIPSNRPRPDSSLVSSRQQQQQRESAVAAGVRIPTTNSSTIVGPPCLTLISVHSCHSSPCNVVRHVLLEGIAQAECCLEQTLRPLHGDGGQAGILLQRQGDCRCQGCFARRWQAHDISLCRRKGWLPI